MNLKLDSAKGLIALNNSTAAEILVLIHPIGGSIICYIKLAKLLEPYMQVFAISSPGFSNDDLNFFTIAELANKYINYYTEWSSPYVTLGGWSFGGLVAYEMARQLLFEHQQINHLLLIDSYAYDDLEKKGGLLHKFITNLLQIRIDAECIEAIAKSVPESKLVEAVYSHLVNVSAMEDNIDLEQFKKLYDIYHQNCLAYSQYKIVSQEQISVKMIRPYNKLSYCHCNPNAVWKLALTDNFTCHYLPGDHYNIILWPDKLSHLIVKLLIEDKICH